MDSLPDKPNNLSVHLPGSLTVFVDGNAWDHAVGYWCHLVSLAGLSQTSSRSRKKETGVEDSISTWPHPSTALAEIIYRACGIRGEGKEIAFYLRYGVTLLNTLRKQPWYPEAAAALTGIPLELAHARGRSFSKVAEESPSGTSSPTGTTAGSASTPTALTTAESNKEEQPIAATDRRRESALPRTGSSRSENMKPAASSSATSVITPKTVDTGTSPGIPSASNSGFGFRNTNNQMGSKSPAGSSFEPSYRVDRMVSEVLFFLENKTHTSTRLAIDFLNGTKQQVDLARGTSGLGYQILEGERRIAHSRQTFIQELVQSGASLYASTLLANPERPDKSRLREIRGFFIPPPGPGVPLQVSQRSVLFFCTTDLQNREAFKLDSATICIGPIEHVSSPGFFV